MKQSSNPIRALLSRARDGLTGTANLTRMRIVSGIILFVYVCVHLINHSLGLISDPLMRGMGGVVSSIIRPWPITYILYTALAVHMILSFWRVYERRSLKMPPREWLQLTLGIAIPIFLITHVMGTRYATAAYGIRDSYDYVLISLFVFAPPVAVTNALGLMASWIHGAIGMHMWMQTKTWYSARLRSWLLVAATLLPTLSLAGYLSAGRRVIPKAADGDFMESYYEKLNLPNDAFWADLGRDINWVEWSFLTLVGLVVVARLIRTLMSSRTKSVRIDYVDGPTLSQSIGPTLLEMSKLGGVPHANVCGGRGRCSTCRVRLLSSDPSVNLASEAELKVLQRVRATEDVRLACQLVPAGDLKVLRLLPSDTERASDSDHEPWSSGREKIVTVMFADLRDFTKTSESRLPFDVVYLINQFSKVMGQAVEDNDGRIDKFLGDGFMALFGVDEAPGKSAHNAMMAAGAMIEELNKLNENLAGDLTEPLRMGIGIHTGSVILGSMGYGHARGLTAIGDTVNTASRLEAATKEQKCILCVSSQTIEQAGLEAPEETKKHIVVRGKKAKLEIHSLMDIKGLSEAKERATA